MRDGRRSARHGVLWGEKWRISRERSARHRVFFDEVSAKVKSFFEISKSWMFVFVAKMVFFSMWVGCHGGLSNGDCFVLAFCVAAVRCGGRQVTLGRKRVEFGEKMDTFSRFVVDFSRNVVCFSAVPLCAVAVRTSFRACYARSRTRTQSVCDFCLHPSPCFVRV